MKRVLVYIDRLVLKGIDPAARYWVAAELQRELGQALTAPAVHAGLAGLGRVAHLKGSTATPQERPAGLGASAARAIARGLKR